MNAFDNSTLMPLSNNVTRVMLLVIVALIPGFAAHVYFFGYGIIVNSVVCIVTALVSEAIMLKLRQRPLWPYLTDGSAIVTALLLAAGLPPLFPAWLTIVACLFAIVIAKHLYGGLGYNPFNPAMVGYALLLIAFPKELTVWTIPNHQWPDLSATLQFSFMGNLPQSFNLDAITSATPLDKVNSSNAALTTHLFAAGWDWINGLYLLGGLFLLQMRIIHWRIPVSILTTMSLCALLSLWISPSAHGLLFHLFGGATMLGAFFIATDPVTASTTPRGQLIYGFGIGLLTFIIRSLGSYPDGVAFAVLLMNMAAPLIDIYTQPRTFGHQQGS